MCSVDSPILFSAFFQKLQNSSKVKAPAGLVFGSADSHDGYKTSISAGISGNETLPPPGAPGRRYCKHDDDDDDEFEEDGACDPVLGYAVAVRSIWCGF